MFIHFRRRSHVVQSESIESFFAQRIPLRHVSIGAYRDTMKLLAKMIGLLHAKGVITLGEITAILPDGDHFDCEIVAIDDNDVYQPDRQ